MCDIIRKYQLYIRYDATYLENSQMEMEILFHNLKHTLGPLSSVLDIVSYRNLALSVDGLLYIFVFKTHKYHTSNLKKLPYEWQDRVISNLNIFCSSYHSLYSLLNYIGWKAEELSPLLYINLSIAKKTCPFTFKTSER